MAYGNSEEEQRQLIHDCFNQNRDRDCYRCPARYSKGGLCCFGDPDQHNSDTEDCRKCLFFDDCAVEVAEKVKAHHDRIEEEARRQAWNRTTYRTTTPPPYNRQAVPIRAPAREQLVQINRRPAVTTSTGGQPIPLAQGETLFQRFVKDTVWGMGQGFFETGANFFRNYRLP